MNQFVPFFHSHPILSAPPYHTYPVPSHPYHTLTRPNFLTPSKAEHIQQPEGHSEPPRHVQRHHPQLLSGLPAVHAAGHRLR